ncbi:Secretory carrier-associated membrane protein 1 [Acorus calamus]|uniref:Secretory carrier-associated membrane protein 1 n=1 Tax=Acorus calamus TaxID=4465 RepID=A0AAV9EAS7_ACOCL|nr:Secretory carrier-associated membrane protein 1 [Acorus calamus]
MIVRPSVTTSPSPTVLSPSTPGYTTSPLITPTGIANLSIFDGDRVEFELNSEEEEKAIRERRFYLHPSPRSRPGEGLFVCLLQNIVAVTAAWIKGEGISPN